MRFAATCVFSSTLWIVSLSAHEKDELVTDPVCGMRLKPKDAAASTNYGGRTFYFCSRDELPVFLTDPNRFSGTSTLEAETVSYKLLLLLEPARATAGKKVRLEIAVTPRNGVNFPDDLSAASSLRITPPYEDWDSFPAYSRQIRLHSIGPGRFGFNKLFPEPADCRLELRLNAPGDEPQKAVFRFNIANSDKWLNELPVVPRGRGEKLKMLEQHQVKRILSEEWMALRKGLSVTGAFWESSTKRVKRIHRAADLFSNFRLHVNHDHWEEYLAYTGEFVREIERLETMLKEKDPASAEALYRIESRNCIRCHLKFRWGNVSDVHSYPDLLPKRKP